MHSLQTTVNKVLNCQNKEVKILVLVLVPVISVTIYVDKEQYLY